jgi:ARG and Rhodanese-Phosphatase-superfamily-associated Protein domain
MDETLDQALQSLEISDPVSHGLLHIFPLKGDIHPEQDISLLEGALQAGTLHIEEPHEAGSVPELRVVNEGRLRVLILEGDELIGAEQNRVVNSSVLVAAGSHLTLPVSCVERGRWSYRSRAFSPGTGSPHLALRRLKTRSVHDSLRRGRGHRSDQRAVWREVDRKARLHKAVSSTHALQDSRSRLSERLDAFEKLARELPEGTSGVVVAIGERLVLLEVLAGPRTFARVFRKLLSGYAFESVGLDRPYGTPDTSAVRSFIEAAAKAAHEEQQAVGAGRDVRFEGDGIWGYALIGETGVLHAAAFAG